MTMLVKEVWLRRLALITQQVEQFNGKISVFYHLGLVNVKIYSPT
jgi:hypothetical protein